MKIDTHIRARALLALPCLVFLLAGLPARAATFSVPDCSRLEPWAATLKPGEMMSVTPRLEISALLRADLTEPLFGVATEKWQRNDFGVAIKQMGACVRAANKRRDSKAAAQLSQASRLIGKAGSAMNRIERFRAAAARDVQAIIDQPGTTEMPAVIDAAVAALSGEGGRSRLKVDPKLAYVAGNIGNLQRAREYLTEADRLELIGRLKADRASTAAEGEALAHQLAEARQAVAAAPTSADGLRMLQQLSESPLLGKVSLDEASAFRATLQQRQSAIRAELNRQQAQQDAQAAAEARRPIDIALRLEQLVQGDAVDAVSLGGLAPGMSRADAVSVLKNAWRFNFEGELPMMNSFVATRPIFPMLKAERRNGGKVELGLDDDDVVGQVRYVEFYKAMLINTTPQAWLSKRLGEPDEVRLGNGGRLMTWTDGQRRLQVLATNQIEEVWRMAGYESELAISVWNEDYEAHLLDVGKRCDATVKTPRNELSMSDSLWFAQHCGLTGASSEHAGI